MFVSVLPSLETLSGLVSSFLSAPVRDGTFRLTRAYLFVPLRQRYTFARCTLLNSILHERTYTKNLPCVYAVSRKVSTAVMLGG